MKKIIKLVKNPKKTLQNLFVNYFLRFTAKIWPDELYLKVKYFALMGKHLNLRNPKSFNEKINWLKLHDRKSLYTTLVDKYTVKKWVADKIGEQYIIPTLGIWDKFEDIDFDKLPNQFVLKCTHDSGGLAICKDKQTFDIENARKKINKSLKRNFYYIFREWPYKNVHPRIIAEKYMSDTDEYKDLTDYKFMCFNGKVKIVFTCTERYSKSGLKVTFFDRKWKLLPFERHYPKSKRKIDKPYNFDKMITIAEILSKEIPFVRVDLYEINNKIYFGELTFFPGAGFEEFTPSEWDEKIGEMLILPNTSTL